MIPIIYYAHAMLIYDTEREQKELKILENFFREGLIYNPNRPYIQQHKNPMGACLHVVADGSITQIAFSEAQPGVISCGIYAELRCAIKRGKPLFLICGDHVEPFRGTLKLTKMDKKRNWARILNASNYSRHTYL
jgi:hypothetical protein